MKRVPKSSLRVIHLSNDLAQETARLLNSFATERPSEGVVYWFGIEGPGIAVVTTLIIPDADTRYGSIHTSEQANGEVVSALVGTPLVYLGQAHSHPGSHVSHSPIDDQHTFARCDGIISVVVPWFGRYGLDVEVCGIYRHENGHFQQVRDIQAHLRIVPGLTDLRAQDNEGRRDGN